MECADECDLIGRDAELDRLRPLAQRLEAGAGGPMALCGPTGAGKTALLRCVACMARSSTVPEGAGPAVSYVVGSEAEREWPYAGLHLVLSSIAGALAPSCRGDVAARLENFVDDLGPSVATYEAARRLQGLMGAVRSSVLLLVDDAHLLDARSQQVLGFLVRRLRSVPVVVILAVDEAAQVEAFHGLNTVRLSELAAPAAERLVLQAGGPRTRSRVAHRLVAMAGGNPGVLLDVVSRVPDAQLSGLVELDRYLPRSPVLHAIYRPEIDGLDEARRMALLVAAASEDGRVAPVLRALREYDDATVAWLLDEHLEQEDDSFTLRRPAVGSVMWQLASHDQQRRAHQLLAGAYADHNHELQLWHLGRNRHHEDEDLAAELHRAARQARSRGAFERALALARESARLSPPTQHRVDRLVTAGELAVTAGRLDEAIHIAQERFGGAASVTQRADLALQEARARSLLDGEVATGLITRHVEEVADADSDRAARLNLCAAIGFAWRMEPAEAARFLRQADRYRTYAQGEVDRLYQRVAAWIASISGDPRHAAASEGDDQPSEDLVAEAELTVFRAMIRVRAERFDEARRALQTVTTDSRFQESPVLLGSAYAVLTLLESRAGRLLAARDAASTWEHAGPAGVWRAVVPAYMIRVHGLLGEPEHAWEWRRRAADSSRRHGDWWATALAQAETGALLLMLGRLDEAVPVLERAYRYAMEHPDPSILLVEPDYVEACVRTGETGHAEAALAALHERALKAPTAWVEHVLARCRALVCDGEESLERFQLAVDTRTGVSPVEMARTMLCYGERLRRVGRRVESTRWLDRATVLAHEAGAKALVARAEEELRASGRKVALESGVPNEVGLDELTDAEQRVAALVATGKRNREIATELFVSVRTVETHLSRIYRKLGIRSRTELAGYVAQ